MSKKYIKRFEVKCFPNDFYINTLAHLSSRANVFDEGNDGLAEFCKLLLTLMLIFDKGLYKELCRHIHKHYSNVTFIVHCKLNHIKHLYHIAIYIGVGTYLKVGGSNYVVDL